MVCIGVAALATGPLPMAGLNCLPLMHRIHCSRVSPCGRLRPCAFTTSQRCCSPRCPNQQCSWFRVVVFTTVTSNHWCATGAGNGDSGMHSILSLGEATRRTMPNLMCQMVQPQWSWTVMKPCSAMQFSKIRFFSSWGTCSTPVSTRGALRLLYLLNLSKCIEPPEENNPTTSLRYIEA